MEKGIKAKNAHSKICREAILCSSDRDLQIAIDEWRLRLFKTKKLLITEIYWRKLSRWEIVIFSLKIWKMVKRKNKTKLIQQFFATIFQNFYFKQIFMQTKLEFEYYIHICLKNGKRTRDVK